MTSLVAAVALDALPEWPTRRLLALRNKLLRCEPSLELSDVQNVRAIDPAVIRFKEDPRWAALNEAILNILRVREHIPNGEEQKLARQARAQRRSGRGDR